MEEFATKFNTASYDILAFVADELQPKRFVTAKAMAKKTKKGHSYCGGVLRKIDEAYPKAFTHIVPDGNKLLYVRSEFPLKFKRKPVEGKTPVKKKAPVQEEFTLTEAIEPDRRKDLLEQSKFFFNHFIKHTPPGYRFTSAVLKKKARDSVKTKTEHEGILVSNYVEGRLDIESSALCSTIEEIKEGAVSQKSTEWRRTLATNIQTPDTVNDHTMSDEAIVKRFLEISQENLSYLYERADVMAKIERYENKIEALEANITKMISDHDEALKKAKSSSAAADLGKLVRTGVSKPTSHAVM